jgi:hypothetical protein
MQQLPEKPTNLLAGFSASIHVQDSPSWGEEDMHIM